MLPFFRRATHKSSLRQSTHFLPKLYRSYGSTSFIMSNRAAFLESEKGKFVVRNTETSDPGEGEVLVKVRL
jgi:hypothetical protein